MVTVNIFFRNFEQLCSQTMQLKSQMTFRQQWRDSRLAFDAEGGSISYLTLTDPSRIWKPDLFFSSGLSGRRHELLNPNSLIRIYPSGDVLYSTRISLTSSCPMDLKFFPHDVQTCVIKMASYGMTTDDLVFQWKDAYPLQVTSNLHLHDFTLNDFRADYATSRTNTGEYSAITASLLFKRDFSRYYVDVYIPCTFFVLLAYVSFWLQKFDHSFLLSLLTTLSLAFFVAFASHDLPKVSYTMSIDVWTGTCLTFALASLFLVLIMNRVPEERKEHKCDEEATETPLVEKSATAQRVAGVRDSIRNVTRRRFQRIIQIAYPVIFLVFTLLYAMTRTHAYIMLN